MSNVKSDSGFVLATPAVTVSREYANILTREGSRDNWNLLCDVLAQPEIRVCCMTMEKFNPLTDSNIILSVNLEYRKDGKVDISTEFRDHDGEGDMIPHSPDFTRDSPMEMQELSMFFDLYMKDINKKYETQVAVTAAALGYKGNMMVFPPM